jgi:TonB family protein
MNTRLLPYALLTLFTPLASTNAAESLSGDAETFESDAYAESVIHRVRPNWSSPTQSANNSVQIKIRVAPDGSVQRAIVMHGSGSSKIDAAIIRAIAASRMEQLPPPYSDVIILFNANELAR